MHFGCGVHIEQFSKLSASEPSDSDVSLQLKTNADTYAIYIHSRSCSTVSFQWIQTSNK